MEKCKCSESPMVITPDGVERGVITPDSTAGATAPKAKMIIQQCLNARLQVAPATATQDEQFVEIGKGVIVFVCFLKGATLDTVRKMARLALNIKLSGDYGERVSVLELPGDVLIAPQSTMGGRPKSRRMVYHRIMDKDQGRQLYEEFVSLCTEIVKKNERTRHKKVKSGVYANRYEAFRLETNGPFTHLFEF